MTAEEQKETAVVSAPSQVFRVEVGAREATSNHVFVQTAHHLGIQNLKDCTSQRLYFLQGQLTLTQAEQLSQQLLVDSVTEKAVVRDLSIIVTQVPPSSDTHFVEVTFLPGVTDPPAENLVKMAHMLGVAGIIQAATGQRFTLYGSLSADDLQRLATEVLANPVIQRFTIDAPIPPPFVSYQLADDTVETILVRGVGKETLTQISRERRLALNVDEMQAIQAYYEQEGRDPTDVELEMIAQTWSEHCVHKTFKAHIIYEGPLPQQGPDAEPVSQQVDGLLKTYIRAATEKVNKTWVRSAFVDNAGIVAFTDRFDLAFKVETHNHPSALEPFGGANTGVGGCVRDVLGVSARPIANTNILCFGPPDLQDVPTGVLHPQRIADGVVHGIEDYGNKMGIPTVNGSILYHPGYTANPLVYCGCLGILPRDSHPTEVQSGDLIIAIGGRTGRDGLRGATFSSMEMDVETSNIAGTAVQIGHPIQEKQVLEVVLRARDEGLYHAITDCGAGGFSSAVGEMAEKLGARVQLQDVILKYPGLRPWEIWLSEAQERMVLAVPATHWPRLQEICAGQDMEAICLGTFADDGRLLINYGDKRVGDLDMHFLHDGLPPRMMQAVWQKPEITPPTVASEPTAKEALLRLLAQPDIRSKEDVIRQYDHEVQGGTVVKPLVGVANHGPSDATVLVPLDNQTAAYNQQQAIQERREAVHNRPSAIKGAALANGICPRYGELDPYAMAWAAIDEAFRNVVAVGADPDLVSILDNFCWGNPNLPDRLGALVRCAQGCYDAAVAYEAPFISGKDSLNNEYTGADGEKHAIPGTLLVSALGIVPDVEHTVTMDLKQPGNFLFVVGDSGAELGGSHYAQMIQWGKTPAVNLLTPPQPVPKALERFRAIHQAIQAGIVQACHDCSEGGIGVALAEMCLAGGVGAEVQLMYVPREKHAAYASDETILFCESLSRFVVEVHPDDVPQFEAFMGQIPHACFGVIGGEVLQINGRTGQPILSTSLDELMQAWRGHLDVRLTMDDLRLEQLAMRRDFLFTPYGVPTHRRTPKVLILHANGTNRDREAALACQIAGGSPEIVHVNQLLAGERHLHDYHMLVIPGGFSYGDDLGAGMVWALGLRHILGEAVENFVQAGRPVLGICNGFQVLVKSGLLGDFDNRKYTLTFNQSGHFECRWVYLQANPNSPCLFTQGIEELIYCPVAHGEGRLAVQDGTVTSMLESQNLIALTYTVPAEDQPVSYPANPNGSALHIAGLCNSAGNVLGLMPHPEDHIFAWHHPRYHRGQQGLLGLPLFQNGIKNA